MLSPIKNNVIVEVVEKETVTAGGIVLARADSEEANRGKVLAIGPTVEDIKLGDEILPNWNKGRKARYDGKDIWVISEDDVVLIFED